MTQVDPTMLETSPKFSAYRSASDQSITTGVWTKAQCQTEDFDTANAYDSTTNYRFQPTVPGYYLITGTIYGKAASALSIVGACVYKNGAAFKSGSMQPGSSTTAGYAVVTAVVYLNGSTDYAELYGYVSGTTPVFGFVGNYGTSIQGSLLP